MSDPAPPPDAAAPPAAKRGGCRGCLVTIAIFAAVPMLLVFAYVGWGVYANARAEDGSKAFCDAIRVGDPQARLDELAKGAHAPQNSFPTDDGRRYMYYGMIYTAYECRVVIVDGRVASKKIHAHME